MQESPLPAKLPDYGWSYQAKRYYHKPILRFPHNGRLMGFNDYRAKCDSGTWIDKFGDGAPATLSPCPKCFRKEATVQQSPATAAAIGTS